MNSIPLQTLTTYIINLPSGFGLDTCKCRRPLCSSFRLPWKGMAKNATCIHLNPLSLFFSYYCNPCQCFFSHRFTTLASVMSITLAHFIHAHCQLHIPISKLRFGYQSLLQMHLGFGGAQYSTEIRIYENTKIRKYGNMDQFPYYTLLM